MEAYQYTLEKIQHMIQELKSKAVDVLDMFSDEIPTCSVRGRGKRNDRTPGSTSNAVGEGKFENGGWARKKGMQTFYTIARLDFEIYI
ncbi:CD2 antigen cytoplasmic tail-binding protein [Dirofilaria immitis]